MKRIAALLLILAVAFGVAGCQKTEISSDISEVSVPQKSGGLHYEKSDLVNTAPSSVSSTVSSAESSTESSTVPSTEASSEESIVSSTVSGTVSDSTSDTGGDNVKTNTSVSVPPSDLNNPTGLVSTDRKNNNGGDWTKTLVNPWNTLHKGYSVNLASIDSRFATDKEFDARAVKYLNEMCEAALNDGVYLTVISAYRSYDYQKMLFDNQIASVKAQNPALSDKEAEDEAATVVARPGTSEHNLGLAVDINSVEESFENTDAFVWLQKHCTEYGFIMRYAKEKQDITGIIYEPWHYRYVGKDLAKKITESGLCMEEWLANN